MLTRILLWSLGGLLLVNIPIFLCQHLTADTVLYDLQARVLFDGGILYRDIVEPNLPGVVWIHAGVRSLLGWSSIAMRSFDLLLLMSSITLLSILNWGTGLTNNRSRAIVSGFIVLTFYLGLSEWCHCQRDTWLLFPALVALLIRRNRLSVNPQRHIARWYQSAIIEGVFWGVAFWIKPHVAIPALCVIFVSLWKQQRFSSWLGDTVSLVVGGGIVGGIGSLWLIQTGAWSHFWDMQLQWNPAYMQAAREKLTWARYAELWDRLFPWGWVHVVGCYIAIQSLKSSMRQEDTQRLLISRQILSALYLGWLAQTVLLQHPFLYVHVPGIILAISLVSTVQWKSQYAPLKILTFAAVLVILLCSSPLVLPSRLVLAKDCLRSGSTLNVRSRIQQQVYPDWDEIAPVIRFLKAQQLNDGELTVYTGTLIHLYEELELKPSTKFVYTDVHARLFRSRTEEISAALENSHQRYIVSGLLEAGMSRDEIDGPTNPQSFLPVDFPESAFAQFPYTQPVVFRSGQYLVHRVEAPTGELCTEYLPLAKEKRSSIIQQSKETPQVASHAAE